MVTKPIKIVLLAVTEPTKTVLIEVTDPVKNRINNWSWFIWLQFAYGDIMKWINVDESYLNYLRQAEGRIPRTDYGKDKYKPFFGVLFEADDFCYVTQVSHPQKRHVKMKQQKDFYKIYDLKKPDHLLAVVNLNYMFPIPKSMISFFEKKKINSYRTFSSEKEKSKYIDLLDAELASINTMNLDKKARYLYDLKCNYPDNKISLRCIDFKQMEELARKYIEHN